MTYQQRYAAIHTWCLRNAIDRPWSFFSAVDKSIDDFYGRWHSVNYKGSVVTDTDEPWLASMERTIKALNNR